jgi:hypothetical protein
MQKQMTQLLCWGHMDICFLDSDLLLITGHRHIVTCSMILTLLDNWLFSKEQMAPWDWPPVHFAEFSGKACPPHTASGGAVCFPSPPLRCHTWPARDDFQPLPARADGPTPCSLHCSLPGQFTGPPNPKVQVLWEKLC